MINRQNWLDVKKHLEYRTRVMQNDPETVRMTWIALRNLIQWADGVPLSKVEKRLPTFPEYILTARNDGREKTLVPKTMRKYLDQTREFYQWAKMALPAYRKVSDLWIETLRLRRSRGEQSKMKIRVYWTLEDVRKVINAATPPLKSERFRRDKAALAFLFLSGMRLGAFVTLSLECVDLDRRKVLQSPEKGVHTKNSKAARTTLLPIPDLMSVVIDWDNYLRGQNLDDRARWYINLGREGGVDKNDLVENGERYFGRRSAFCQGLKELCDIAGVAYKSPHKIRHGFGVYGVKHSPDMKTLKAVSQNMMHSNIGITDSIYGVLPEDDVFDIISNMSE